MACSHQRKMYNNLTPNKTKNYNIVFKLYIIKQLGVNLITRKTFIIK